MFPILHDRGHGEEAILPDGDRQFVVVGSPLSKGSFTLAFLANYVFSYILSLTLVHGPFNVTKKDVLHDGATTAYFTHSYFLKLPLSQLITLLEALVNDRYCFYHRRSRMVNMWCFR